MLSRNAIDLILVFSAWVWLFLMQEILLLFIVGSLTVSALLVRHDIWLLSFLKGLRLTDSFTG
jgi:hypothetical protein